MKIFLSYSSKDSDFALILKNRLIYEGVTIVTTELEPKVGDNIATHLEANIKSANAYIILVSKSFDGSQWSELELLMIYDEVSRRKGQKKIFPVLLDTSAKIPPLLSNLLYADLTNKDKINEQIDFLVKSIQEINTKKEQTDYKTFKHLIKEKEEFLKYQMIEYELQQNRQKRTKKMLTTLLFLILFVSALISLILFIYQKDNHDIWEKSTSIESLIFYALGLLTGTIPSLYLSFKRKPKNDK